MKCPLLLIGKDTVRPMYNPYITDCLKEECAWWVDGEGGCLLVFIEKDLAGIWTMLTVIANKMPHEMQFRK